ncbi:hypothetical protein [Tellurirhabdus bombi]|uniref:hypothetical protein n=1 Tax=Tellurirhabdus bombi TaxID=2907205 RepID=UPI001F44160A|nr:hypothetical protein [Tellurirhabdus bombi]
MKKQFTVFVFLVVWFLAANFLMEIDFWKPYLHRIVIALVSIIAGMSVSATIAILTLSLTDRVLDKVQTIGADANPTMVPPIKN